MAKSLKATALRWNQLGPWDLRVDAGQCLGVSGPSGAGKSVLLRMLADLMPHEGHCWLDGADCATMPAPEWRGMVRYCAATSGWWAPTVADHFTDITVARSRAAQVGLEPALLTQSPDRLSTGEKQRLALLRSLEGEPAFLLLDEPTSALDAATTRLVENLVTEQMQQGVGMVLVSHDTAQLQRMAHGVLEIRK